MIATEPTPSTAWVWRVTPGHTVDLAPTHAPFSIIIGLTIRSNVGSCNCDFHIEALLPDLCRHWSRWSLELNCLSIHFSNPRVISDFEEPRILDVHVGLNVHPTPTCAPNNLSSRTFIPENGLNGLRKTAH